MKLAFDSLFRASQSVMISEATKQLIHGSREGRGVFVCQFHCLECAWLTVLGVAFDKDGPQTQIVAEFDV